MYRAKSTTHDYRGPPAPAWTLAISPTAMRRVAALLTGGTLGLLAFCLACAARLPPLEPLPGVGNFPRVVRRLADLPAGAPARIVFVGDPNEFRVYNLPEYLRAAQAQRPDLIVLGGDLVHGEVSALKMRLALDEIRRSGIGTPVVIAVGNHDVNPSDRWFARAFGARRMEFPLRHLRIVLEDLKRPGPIPLAGGPATLIFVHEPVFEPDGRRTRYARHVVDPPTPPAMILTGHRHHFRDLAIGGMRQITAGGDDRFLVLLEALPGDPVRATPLLLRPGRPPFRRLFHFGIRALDDILHLRPKAALWLVPLLVAALLARTASALALPARR